MPLNLITDPWLPVRLAGGGSAIIRPAQMVECLGTDREAVAPDWPRPDLNVATYELLIGLLSVAFAPPDTKHWHRLFNNPPSTKELDAALAPLAFAFNLDGPAPRFCQDFEELAGEAGDIEALFIDSAGEATAKKNADLMVKRRRYGCLSRPAAAIALYALQQFAPTGGSGHRTSMRGGGPLTTLVLPPANAAQSGSLWHTIWTNVAPAEDGLPDQKKFPLIFPWLAPAITSENGLQLHQADEDRAHHLQAFFGTPRRIRLVFAANEEKRPCDLTGRVDEMAVTGYVTRPHGVNYGQWQHPLTPYYRKKPQDTEQFATHPSAGRFGYHNWLAATVGDEEKTRIPSTNVTTFRLDREKRMGGDKPRLLVAGWAMSNMKPLDFLLAEQPLHSVADEIRQKRLDQTARDMVKAADSAARMLTGAVQDALKAGGNKPKAESSLIVSVRESFFAETEDRFHDLLSEAARDAATLDSLYPARAQREAWLAALRDKCLTLFDDAASPDPFDPQKARQVVKAREKLTMSLWRRKGKNTLEETIGLPEPAGKKGKAS